MKEALHYPVIVVGGGHAGCEAALASARCGVETLLLTINISTIAMMPCNPSIGGPGKGHIVREIGALGGEMARCIDENCIQIKWLNTSKGLAVRARRAQADKSSYQDAICRTLFSTPKLSLKQASVIAVLTSNGRVTGVKTETGVVFSCDRVVIATGTYLKSRIIIGTKTWSGGPNGQPASNLLSESLRSEGISLRRLQTATPPRVHRSTVDFSVCKELPGEPESGGFMWENRQRVFEDQISCHMTWTDERVVETVHRHLPNSPLKLGNITNTGPKHCPSIDRKVIKFPQMTRHLVFLEPEGRGSSEIYLQGLTTGMPPEAQREIIAGIPGLTGAKILRYGYAIEYDALSPGTLRSTMASRVIEGLYTAGQINGTSGYEEAAAQGLVAGINAALSVKGKAAYVPSRTNSYIGVLVDDLATWEAQEPYRMTPANAEFRLLLRDETAENRLTAEGHKIGLVSNERYGKISDWSSRINREIDRLNETMVFPDRDLREKLTDGGTGDLKKSVSTAELLQRPGINYRDLAALVRDKSWSGICLASADEIGCVETAVRYSGYAARYTRQREQSIALESVKLPMRVSEKLSSLLSTEAREVICSGRFENLYQAVRKSCLSTGEIAILMLHLKQRNDSENGH